MRKRIYISGKVTGTTDYVERFAKAEESLKDMGETYNPVTHTANIPAGSPWIEYMKVALAGMFTCNTIYMLRGWEDSPGAKIEHDLAVHGGYEVIYEESTADKRS